MSDTKRMNAKFPGTCKACGKEIRRGASIEWSKERGAMHPNCELSSREVVPKDSKPAAPSAGQGRGKTWRENLPCDYCGKVKPTRKRPCDEPCPDSAVPSALYETCDRWHRACFDCVA